jgi:propionyl-CoA synthetase
LAHKEYIRYKHNNEFVNEHYDKIYKQSIEDKEAYFDGLAKEVSWNEPYTKVNYANVIG